MMPGPTLIFRCMRCGGEFLKRTISSGNTLRATYRSDGKMTAPMLPRTPELAACPHCGEAIWFREYEPIEKFDLYRDGNNFDALFGDESSDLSDISPVDEAKKRIEEENRKVAKARAQRLSSLHENTPTAGALSPEKCLLFIEAQLLPEVTEISLRMQVMHLVNDRRCLESDPVLSPAESKNMHQLLELLKEDDESSVLLRAEIHREFGQFSAAKKESDRGFMNGAKAE
jgi:DNA-directed RNA polymerase subunit RPC12/RpoP